MQVAIRLLKDDQVLQETPFVYKDFSKASVQNFLTKRYSLIDGYDVSYVDTDGDEIMVEFEDDYEVAKLTHCGNVLCLLVKVQNQEWYSQYKQKVAQESLREMNENNVELILSSDDLTGILREKLQQQCKEKSIQEDQSINSSSIIQIYKEINLIQFSQQQIQFSEEKIDGPISSEQKVEKSKIHSKRTETQSSSSDSDQELLMPTIKQEKKSQTTFDLFSIARQFPSVQSHYNLIQEKQPEQQPKEKETSTPKKKKAKPEKNISKIEKKKSALTEKQIKNLIKKEVLKLLPEISKQLKKTQKENDQNYDIELKKQANKEKLIFSKIGSKCSQCQDQLKIPFYINSFQNIIICAKCQSQDQSTLSLVKIRDEKMLGNLVWAQPLCLTSSQTKESQENISVKQCTQLKKAVMNQVKEVFDKKIKEMKKQVKKEKAQKKKQKKQQEKQKIYNPVDSASSSV